MAGRCGHARSRRRRQPAPAPEPGPEPEAEHRPPPTATPPAAATGERSPELAALLSLVAPGSGHLYLGRAGVAAVALLAVTLVAVILAYFDFALFLAGAAMWAGAAAYALYDLRRRARRPPPRRG